MTRDSLNELSEKELRQVRGGDLCIVAYEQVDEDGDGRPDILIPIYGDCLVSGMDSGGI